MDVAQICLLFVCVSVQFFNVVQLETLDTTVSSSSSSTTDRSTEVTDLFTLLSNVNGTLSTTIDDSAADAASDSVVAGSTRVYVPVTQATRQASKVQRKRGSAVVGSESKVRVSVSFLFWMYPKVLT